MNTNQMTLANAKRVRLADQADVARLTAVPKLRTDLVARLATVPGLVRPGIAHWDMKTRLLPHGEVHAANGAVDVLTEGAADELLQPPVKMLRLMLHPDGMAKRVGNLSDWGRHVLENLRARARRSPDPRLDEFIDELAGYVPSAHPGPDHLGFAVPLRLRCREGELHLITTLTSFITAVDITVAELHLEVFLPADDATAGILRTRARQDDRTSRP